VPCFKNPGESWDDVYKGVVRLEDLPWYREEPPDYLVKLVKSGNVRGPVLDLCTGAGTNAVYLAKEGFRVTGTDISPAAIKYAKERAEEAQVKCAFVVADFTNLPFKDESFGLVLDRGCFHQVANEDRKKFVTGVHRVLKKDGVYSLTCHSDRNVDCWGLQVPEEDIGRVFSPYFEIEYIKEIRMEIHGNRRYFHNALMKKRTLAI
jgi:ubiquinone/menaquinone biosynthesis C-methylase UbiE